MENGSLIDSVRIKAPAALVYEVVSSPEHIARWWADEADVPGTPGESGSLVFHDGAVRLTVVEAVPGTRFSFRWNHPAGEAATARNSLLVTFDLAPDGDETVLTVTEEGLREQGWEAAVLEEYYDRHSRGWRTCLTAAATYISGLR